MNKICLKFARGEVDAIKPYVWGSSSKRRRRSPKILSRDAMLTCDDKLMLLLQMEVDASGEGGTRLRMVDLEGEGDEDGRLRREMYFADLKMLMQPK